MMNLKHLSNLELHESAVRSASKARLATTALLHHLCEVQRRRVYAEFGCESLFSYCVKHLGMDNPEAARHVNAARLMTEFPEIEEKINSSSMSLTSVSQAQTFFKQEAKLKNPASREKKREILEKIESKSTREVESILRSHSSSPEKHFVERTRVISDSLTEVTTSLDNETIRNLDRLKEIWSHSMPGAKYSEIIKKAVQEARERHDPQLKAERAQERKTKTAEKAAQRNDKPTPAEDSMSNSGESSASKESEESQPTIVAPSEAHLNSKSGLNEGDSHSFRKISHKMQSNLTRYIHSTVKHAVWMRDSGCCTYVDPRTGERCGSRYYLQYDHVIPFAMGGVNTAANLRLRCRAHNQLHAIQTYGLEVLKYANF